jgi:glyoxylase-like metal-dependent hydrolase (beta-lactamase superfamily II)
MKKTFTTVMPDKVGAFLAASRILSGLGLNITRVSYNKAVDTHMLFIDVEGEAEAIGQAERRLGEIGYLPNKGLGNVILIEFHLRDVPGTVQPILELIGQYQFNISYISSQGDGSPYQEFRMGLFVESGESVASFLKSASQLCEIKILNYNPTGSALDNTVFYMSFANRIAAQNGLDERDKSSLIVDANLIMEMLTQQNSPPYKTFDYIGKFAEGLVQYRGERFQMRVTEHDLPGGRSLTLLEPPCGSNLCVMLLPDRLLCVDGGFPCYRGENLAWLRKTVPDFDLREKILLLTHADVDHVGLAEAFDRVYLSRRARDNFVLEREGRPNLREQNPAHAPYLRISKLLSHYKTLSTKNMHVIGGGHAWSGGLLERIGEVDLDGLHFEAYEAAGGHVPGETVYVERGCRLVFTGDIFVNIKGFTPQQAKFNKYAPYLMTSVDTDPKLAAAERKEIFRMLGPGEWLLIGGHGAAMKVTTE